MISLRPDLLRKPKARRAHKEQDFQIATAKALGYLLTKDVMWSAIGHGGGGKVRGAILKAMGVRPGLGDIWLRWWKPGAADSSMGWLELKTAKGRQSPDQITFSNDCRRIGDEYAVVRSLDEVIDTLAGWQVPLRKSR